MWIQAQNPSANFASSLIFSGDQGGSKTIELLTESTPSRGRTNSSICYVICGPIGHAGVVSVNVTWTLPLSCWMP